MVGGDARHACPMAMRVRTHPNQDEGFALHSVRLDQRREVRTIEHARHDPRQERPTIELTHVIRDRNEAIDKRCVVYQVVFALVLHGLLDVVGWAAEEMLPHRGLDEGQDSQSLPTQHAQLDQPSTAATAGIERGADFWPLRV
eukprot:SAG31_NODE_1351_length_8676_cov_3.112044_2_plen_143_part_00